MVFSRSSIFTRRWNRADGSAGGELPRLVYCGLSMSNAGGFGNARGQRTEGPKRLRGSTEEDTGFAGASVMMPPPSPPVNGLASSSF